MRQISNDQTNTKRGFLNFIGLTAILIIGFYFLERLDSDFSFLRYIQTILSVVILTGLLYYFSTARFYTVHFDNKHLFLLRFGKKEQISLDKIILVQPSIFPFKTFYKNVYCVTIEYKDNRDTNRKIKFLSKGYSENGTIDDIPLLDTLKQLIKEKKYLINYSEQNQK